MPVQGLKRSPTGAVRVWSGTMTRTFRPREMPNRAGGSHRGGDLLGGDGCISSRPAWRGRDVAHAGELKQAPREWDGEFVTARVRERTALMKVKVTCRKPGQSGADMNASLASENEVVIDVRPMPPRVRHPSIFSAWDRLADGGAILLVNDHDPVPLYYQFAAECVGGFRWEYLEQGPEVWRVRISKGLFADPGFRPEPGARGSCRPQSVPISFVQPHVLDVVPSWRPGNSLRRDRRCPSRS